jgi:hypothetical protein
MTKNPNAPIKLPASAILLTVLAIPACSEGPRQDQPPQVVRLSGDVCRKATKLLDDLKAKVPFEFRTDGTATVAQEAWVTFPEDSRKSLATALAYQAACSSERPGPEQEVVIRSELGQVLSRRRVSTVPQTIELN